MRLTRLYLAISCILTLQVQANDYALQNSKNADMSRWNCSECRSEGTWEGSASAGAGYLDNGGSSRFYNWNPPVYGTASDNKHLSASLNVDVARYQDDGFYHRLIAEDLGLQRFLLQWEIGQFDGFRLLTSYRETPYFWNRSSLSAYHNSGNILTSGALSQHENEVKRETLKLELKYTPHTPWKPYASMKHERKEGSLSLYSPNVPNLIGAPGFIPKTIDNETLNTHAGVSYIEDSWLVDIAYRGSFFRNDHAALYYGDTNNPYANHIAYAPDNDFHQFAISGNYRIDQHTIIGRVLWSQASSEGGLNPFPQSPVNSDTFHGKMNSLQVSADYHYKLSRQTALALSADYLDKDDKSDRNTLIGFTREEYDRTKTKLEAKLDHHFNRDVSVNAGYHYKQDKREYADRKRTNEHRASLGSQYHPDGPWYVGGNVSYSQRDGSGWTSSNDDSPNLRQYYLADRERLELRADGNYEINDNFQLVAEVWYANDDYPKPDVGLSEGEDYGYDISLNFYLLDGMSGHVFYNQQTIRSEQQLANSDVIGWDRYTTKLKDDITTIGFGISKDRLLDEKLSLSFDYSYNQGKGESSVSSDGYQYPDNESTSYRYEFSGDYEVTESQSVEFNIRYEDYAEEDYLFNNEAANMGEVLQSYEGFYGSVYWKYRF
ncbi:MtrB/PioB family decaheme-associated outer membrane protein [Vibrio alfacsensis]|uniref:MtrB/PioB family decaheme-associated outer membrane protein n=1 Tax=Vibrio alfacsensis TaxID=1074311 RepID=UPI0040680701